jgi:uncharacterized membrane protein YdjX (TVP38/TMEM64 family)
MHSAESPLDSHARLRHYFQLIIFGVILDGLTVVTILWGPRLWEVLTDQEQFKEWIAGYGAYAAWVFVAAQFVQVVIFFIPGEVTQCAGGYLFGTWLGLVLSYLGITLGSLTAFALARLFAHSATDLLVARQTVRQFDRLVYGKAGCWPMFLLFVLPGIPKDLLCYIASLTPMPVATFLVISTIGRFPGVFLSSLFGDGLAERDWTVVGLSTGIILGLVGIVYLLRVPIERFRRQYMALQHPMIRLEVRRGTPSHNPKHCRHCSLPRSKDGAGQEDFDLLPHRSRKDWCKDPKGTAKGDRQGEHSSPCRTKRT